MNDTSTQAEEMRLRILRAMPPSRRLAMAAGWSSSLRQMTRNSLKKEFGTASEMEIKRLMAERWLGPELATKVYGPVVYHG
jgi:hypothetical protein